MRASWSPRATSTARRWSGCCATGADVNARNRLGETALVVVLKQDRIDLAQVLLAAGADVNVAAVNGITPLMAAAYGGHTDMVSDPARTRVPRRRDRPAEEERDDLCGGRRTHGRRQAAAGARRRSQRSLRARADRADVGRRVRPRGDDAGAARRRRAIRPEGQSRQERPSTSRARTTSPRQSRSWRARRAGRRPRSGLSAPARPTPMRASRPSAAKPCFSGAGDMQQRSPPRAPSSPSGASRS